MLQVATSNLPREQQERLHPDFLRNEQTYFRMRDSLLSQYQGHWVAVDDDRIVATGSSLMEVMQIASANGRHPYVGYVGGEEKVVFRVRRSVYGYDLSYQPLPLPRVSARFANRSESRSQQFPDVIPDTGADVSILPDTDCAAIDLYQSPCITGMSGGVVGPNAATLFYQGKVEIDGRSYCALIQPIPGGQERIVGRDVLNQIRILFDGPGGQVVVNP